MAGWLAGCVFSAVHLFVRIHKRSPSRCKNHLKDSNKKKRDNQVKWKINLASKWKTQMEHNEQRLAPFSSSSDTHSVSSFKCNMHFGLFNLRSLFILHCASVVRHTHTFFHTFRQKTGERKYLHFSFRFFALLLLLLFYCRMALIVTSAICVYLLYSVWN